MHEGVLEHAAVARGEHEAVAVEPGVVLGVVRHRLAVDDIAHRGAAHGKTGVTGVGLVDGVNGEETHGVDAIHHGVRGYIRGRGERGADRLHGTRGNASRNLLRLRGDLRAGEGGVERSHLGSSGGHLSLLNKGKCVCAEESKGRVGSAWRNTANRLPIRETGPSRRASKSVTTVETKKLDKKWI